MAGREAVAEVTVEEGGDNVGWGDGGSITNLQEKAGEWRS